MHLDHARARGLLLSAMLLAATTVTAAPLDVKLGLWESTVTTEASGAPPMDLSSLTPEQKARVKAASSLVKFRCTGPVMAMEETVLIGGASK